MSQTKLYVGDLKEDVNKDDLEKVFSPYGDIRQVWVSHNPPGYAFVEFEDPRDAKDAARALDKRTVLGSKIRVEFSRGIRRRYPSEERPYQRPLRRPFNPADLCYECGQPGHYAYDCEIRIRRMRNARAYYPSPYRARRRSGSSRREDSYRRRGSRSRSHRRRYRSPSESTTPSSYRRSSKRHRSRSSSASRSSGRRYSSDSRSRTDRSERTDSRGGSHSRGHSSASSDRRGNGTESGRDNNDSGRRSRSSRHRSRD